MHDELHRLGETLNAMLARLEATAKHERTFLAHASHELRTPLAILKTEVDLALHDGAREPELRAALESIGEEADRLVRLSEDLLVIARGQDGTLPLDARPVDVREVARAVAERFAVVGEGLRWGGERVVVRADRLRLEQAVGNLVDNALRHGAGPVALDVRRCDDMVELHVTDAGPGFGAERRERAFDGIGGGRGGGFGLGLPIVATIARAHGGRVGVADTERGADVWLALPLDRV